MKFPRPTHCRKSSLLAWKEVPDIHKVMDLRLRISL